MTKKKPQNRKEEIILSALKQSDNVSPDKLSASMIAREIGISQPAIFRHFPTMNILWIAIANYIENIFVKKWEAILSSSSTPPQKLKMIIKAQLNFVMKYHAIPTILFSREFHSRDKKLQKTFASIMRNLHKHLTKIICDGQETGYFKDEFSAEDNAFLIIGFIQGLIVRWSVGGKSFSLISESNRLLEIQLRILLKEEK